MTLSHTLQSSPNQDQDQRPQSLFSLHLITLSPNSWPQLRVSDLTLSLSLISISYLSLLVSDTDSSLKRSLYLSLSLSQSQILKSKARNLFTKSSSLTQTLSVSHSLISAVPLPISYEISNLHHFNFHPSSIFTL